LLKASKKPLETNPKGSPVWDQKKEAFSAFKIRLYCYLQEKQPQIFAMFARTKAHESNWVSAHYKLPRQVGSGVHTDIPGAHIGCDFSEVAPTSPQGFNGRYSFKCYATGLLKNYPVVGKEQFLLVCKQFLMFCSTHNRKVHRFFSDDDSVILSVESR